MTHRDAVDVAADALTFGYTNYRGEYSIRRVIPDRVWFGSTSWHPEPQWLLSARDLDKESNQRDFALRDIVFDPEALRSASNSGAEAMREAVQADLSAYIDKNEARIAANPYEMQDRILLEERVMALDAARSRVAALPLPAPGAPASPWRPIEEAPKDANHVIVGHEGYGPQGEPPWSLEAWYCVDHNGWWAANTDPTDAHDGQVYPTCFMPMPLPTPPASKDT